MANGSVILRPKRIHPAEFQSEDPIKLAQRARVKRSPQRPKNRHASTDADFFEARTVALCFGTTHTAENRLSGDMPPKRFNIT
jgi:hypothetical protein